VTEALTTIHAIHPIFVGTQFMDDSYLNSLVSDLMHDDSLDATPIGSLTGRAVPIDDSCFLISLVNSVILFFKKIWHMLCLSCSSEYLERFNHAAELISLADKSLFERVQAASHQRTLEAEQVEEDAAREKAAIKIQNVFRGYRAKTAYQDLKQLNHVKQKIEGELARFSGLLQELVSAEQEYQRTHQEYQEAQPKTRAQKLIAWLPTTKKEQIETAQKAYELQLKNFIGRVGASSIEESITVIEARKAQQKALQADLEAVQQNIQSRKDFLFKLCDDAEEVRESIVAVPTATTLTHSQQMLKDLVAKTHPEIAQMWEILISKFPNEELIKSWKLNEDGTYKIELIRPFCLWVSDEEYDCNGGVVLLFGPKSDGVIEGTLFRGEIPGAHKNAVQSTRTNQPTDQRASIAEPAGMTFNKPSNESGIQTYCKFNCVIWPQANYEHFIRIGETEEGKRNIILSGTCMGQTQGRARSLSQIKESWQTNGIVLPSHIDYKEYLTARSKGKTHDQIVAEVA